MRSDGRCPRRRAGGEICGAGEVAGVGPGCCAVADEVDAGGCGVFVGHGWVDCKRGVGLSWVELRLGGLRAETWLIVLRVVCICLSISISLERCFVEERCSRSAK